MLKILEKDFESFFNTPFAVRGKNTLYASPFKSDLKKMLSTQNPIFKKENDFTFYTVLDNGKPVGRITAHIHHEFNKRYNGKKCYFGFFECVNDHTVANTLFGLAEKFAGNNNCDSIAGNFNLTAMQEMGVMTSGFEKEPYLLQSFGMPYYPGLMAKAGYSPVFPMSTFEIDLPSTEPEKIISEKQKQLLDNPEYDFMPITKKTFPKLSSVMLEIFNKGFDKNPLFVPISQEEFDFQAKDLVYIIDNHISFLVRHKGKPIGLSIHIPDINPILRATGSRMGISTLFHFIKHSIKRERVLCIFAAILPEYQKQGVAGAILYLAINAMKKRGYKKFGITWISETNNGSMRKMQDYGARKLHDLMIFEKNLSHNP